MVIVIGLGLFGITCARILAEAGIKVAAFDRRECIGGNSACYIDKDTGIEVHRYGSHIFHTSNSTVYEFVRRFTDLNGYSHKAIAYHNGKYYLLPIGLNLINKFFSVELRPCEVDSFLSISNRKNLLFDAFIRGYSSKQWGVPPEQVSSDVINRLPVRNTYDTNYFYDYKQGIPDDGYMSMFTRILDHPNITTKLRTEVKLRGDRFWTADGALPVCHTIYSGPIDELFGYRYGPLPWRSLSFDTEVLNTNDYQGTAIVNYPDRDVSYTRIHEYKHYHPEWHDVMRLNKTIICREYPKKWSLGDEPYYPIDSADSHKLFMKYVDLASSLPWLKIGGRLGSFRYMDMDDVIAQAIEHVKEFVDE